MTKISTVSLAASMVLALAAAGSATAAPASADRSPTRVADATQIRPVAAADQEDEVANCVKPRKRLWIEGEGWVVRKVTICR